jgi:hypothetical protein
VPCFGVARKVGYPSDKLAQWNSASTGGHYAYFRIADNFRALQKAYSAVERYWLKMLCSWGPTSPFALV